MAQAPADIAGRIRSLAPGGFVVLSREEADEFARQAALALDAAGLLAVGPSAPYGSRVAEVIADALRSKMGERK